jgi:hypothetical protein
MKDRSWIQKLQKPPKPPSPRWIKIADAITDRSSERDDRRRARGKRPRRRGW